MPWLQLHRNVLHGKSQKSRVSLVSDFLGRYFFGHYRRNSSTANSLKVVVSELSTDLSNHSRLSPSCLSNIKKSCRPSAPSRNDFYSAVSCLSQDIKIEKRSRDGRRKLMTAFSSHKFLTLISKTTKWDRTPSLSAQPVSRLKYKTLPLPKW